MQKLTINLYLLFSIHKNQQTRKLKQPLHSKEGERNTLRNTQNGPLNQEQQEQKTGTQKGGMKRRLTTFLLSKVLVRNGQLCTMGIM